MDKKTLSLCMIVKNEAHQLEELLRQVKEVVDEIVIVDTGSEDGTLEIAKHYTSLVFHFPWQNDFSAARNFALDRARGDYFLWLDADDRLPEESVKKIAALKDYFDGEKFFSFILEDLKGGSVQSRCYQVRCAPLRRNIRFRYKVHEELISSLREAGCREVNTNIVIRHHGYQDPDTLREKMKRNLRLLLEDFAIRKDDVNYTLSLANSYLYFEQYERASGILNDYLRSENAHGCPRRALIEIYSLLAYIEILKGNRSDALRWLVKAEAIGVEGKIEWYRLGCAYESLGELTRAIRAFDQTLRAPYILGSLPTIPEVSEWEVSLRRSVTFYRMGKFLEAREALKEAIKFGTGVKEAVTWLFQHLLCLKEYGLVERLVIEEEISKIISYWESHFYRGLCLLFKN
ncbi:MAG: glycosyltransferase family 2 protein, partial [Deltaproteobacteria bacterium]|nr:glycosyltransferase family 2 protein [Deltaproteobacteria bacterium]